MNHSTDANDDNTDADPAVEPVELIEQGDPADTAEAAEQNEAVEAVEAVDPELVRQRQQLVLTHIVKIARDSRSDSSKLKRFLRRYERSPGELDDIIQDAMLEATRCADRFQAR